MQNKFVHESHVLAIQVFINMSRLIQKPHVKMVLIWAITNHE